MASPMPLREALYQIPHGEHDPIGVCPWTTPGDGPPLDVPPRLHLDALARLGQGRGVRILTIGTGCEASHPGMAGVNLTVNMIPGTRATTGDQVGHGTAMAGIIAGRVGIGAPPGPAALADLYAAQVWSSCGYAPGSAVVDALRVAKDIKPHVILWGVEARHVDNRILDLVHDLHQAGAVHIAPAGSGPKGRTLTGWPAKSEVVLSVTGLNGAGDPLSGCATGPDVDLGAWGGPRFVLWSGGRVGCLSGSGPAAALVAAIAAVMVGRRIELGLPLGADVIRGELLASCHLADPYRSKRSIGYGELRVAKWLSARQGDGYRPDQPPLPWPADGTVSDGWTADQEQHLRHLLRFGTPPPTQ